MNTVPVPEGSRGLSPWLGTMIFFGAAGFPILIIPILIIRIIAWTVGGIYLFFRPKLRRQLRAQKYLIKRQKEQRKEQQRQLQLQQQREQEDQWELWRLQAEYGVNHPYYQNKLASMTTVQMPQPSINEVLMQRAVETAATVKINPDAQGWPLREEAIR